MAHCSECVRLREECALAYAKYTSCRDELALTEKRDKSFTARRTAFEKATGRLRECRAQEASHLENHRWHLPSDEEVEPKVARLKENIGLNDADAVQNDIFSLSAVVNGWRTVPDAVVEELLTLLRDEKMYASEMSGHLLNYFESEAGHLTHRQKSLCIGFLNAHGDMFTSLHSQVVVEELRGGDYLK